MSLEGVVEKLVILPEVDASTTAFPGAVLPAIGEDVAAVPAEVKSETKEVRVLVSTFLLVSVLWVWWVWEMSGAESGEVYVEGSVTCSLRLPVVEITDMVWGLVLVLKGNLPREVLKVMSGLVDDTLASVFV